MEDGTRIGSITPLRQTASEILAEQRGKSAIEKLTPKRKDWPDELPLVGIFTDPADAADHLVSKLGYDFGEAIVKNVPMDWSRINPVLELMAYRTAVEGRRAADIARIGEPPKLGYIEPQKKKRGRLSRWLRKGDD